MDKDLKFLNFFKERYENALIDLGLSCINNYTELEKDILKTVCYPSYTHTDYFRNQCNRIATNFVYELPNSLKILNHGKIRNYDIIYNYCNSLFDNYQTIVEKYFSDMLGKEDVNMNIATDLQTRVIEMIVSSRSSIRRNIKMILDAHNIGCKIKMRKKIEKFLINKIPFVSKL
jgi:hypothetical protein